MATRKLWTHRRTAIVYFSSSFLLPLASCANRKQGIGLSLSFYNKGISSLLAKRFDFDGQRGPFPGPLGPGGGGSHMSFMPGDTQGGIPRSVEIEWFIYSNEFLDWSKNTPQEIKYSSKSDEIYEKLWATNPHYVQRVDLTPILTPELISKIRADRPNTQLKMIVIFRDDKVEITAEPYKWR
jgi:hypothetical protein